MKKIIGVSLFIVIFVGFNYFINGLSDIHALKFFLVPFRDILNIFFISGVVYFFVEYKNDTRGTKKFLETIASRMVKRIEDTRMYHIRDKADIGYVRIVQKLVSNELSILEKCSKDFGFEEEAVYCREKFTKYWDLVSDHIENIKKYEELEIELQNHIVNLISNIEFITLKLHKK
jgi:hypothetical protein